MEHFLATICVALAKPIPELDNPASEVIGYYRTLALGAANEQEARSLIVANASDGSIDWSDSTIRAIDIDSHDREITKHCKHPSEAGIWWKSGRVFFPRA